MVNGQAIYYKGYQSYLDGEKQIEELMASSFIQSLIISRLLFLLQSQLGNEYEPLTNEVGIQFAPKSWRGADIAILRTADFEVTDINNKYLNFAPEVVIEIDTKAELRDIANPLGYYHVKTDELLQFGIQKVLWIFTDSQKVMVAEQGKRWETSGWDEEVEVINGIFVNVSDLIKKQRK